MNDIALGGSSDGGLGWVNRNLKLMASVAFFSNLLFFIPILTLFLLERGLSYTQIFLFGAVASLSSALLELPSGMLADRYGRKRTLILFTALMLLFNSMLYVAREPQEFLITAIVWGAATAAYTGSSEALIYESLRSAGREEEAKKAFGRIYASQLAALMIAPIIGSLIASSIDLSAPVAFSIPMSAVALATVLLVKEPIHTRSTHTVSYGQILRDASRVVREKETRNVVLNQALATVVMNSMYQLSQPLFLRSGIDVAYFGPIFTAGIGLAAALTFSADRIESRLGAIKTAYMTALLPAALFLTLSTINVHLVSAASFVLIVSLREVRDTLFTSYRNKFFSPESRSTMVSSAEMLTSILALAVKLSIGVAADVDISYAFLLCGALLAIGPLLLRFKLPR